MPLRMPIRHALIIANDFCYHLYIMFNLYSSTRAFDIHVVLIYIYTIYELIIKEIQRWV